MPLYIVTIKHKETGKSQNLTKKPVPLYEADSILRKAKKDYSEKYYQVKLEVAEDKRNGKR